MASNIIVAKRYAKALISSCQGVEAARAVLAPLSGLAQGVRISTELSALLRNPDFTSADKWTVVKALAEKFNSPEQLVRFLKVLTFNQRANVLPEVEEVFKEHLLALDASVDATVEAAVSLSDANLAQISGVLTKIVGKKVNLVQELSPELIAGIKVHILGKTLDASFASNLELVHRELLVAQA